MKLGSCFAEIQKIDFSNYLTQSAFTFSKLIIEILEPGVNVEHMQHLVLVFLLLTLKM